MLRNVILGWSGTLTDGLALVPHGLEFLRFCHATRRRLFLLSTVTEARFASEAGSLAVLQYFERTYLGAAGKRERIGAILAENQLAAAETAFVSATPGAVESAKLAGVLAIATLTGFESSAKLCEASPDVIVRDLGELRKLLETAGPADEIRIEELELLARVGVPDEERAQPQRLVVSLTLQPPNAFSDLGDDLARTVDYAAVCQAVRSFVSDRRDKLIETMAHEVAEHLLRKFELARVEVELRKFVLPETRYVAVRVARPGTDRS